MVFSPRQVVPSLGDKEPISRATHADRLERVLGAGYNSFHKARR